MIIVIADTEIELTPEGAVWLPAYKVLAASDLHIEKDSFFSKNHTFLPPYGTLETLQKLEKLLDRYHPDIFVAAGDSFHDKHAASRMEHSALIALNGLVDKVQKWFWLAGNHDVTLQEHIHGLGKNEIQIGNIFFRHQTQNQDQAEISGHYHPKIRTHIMGHYLTAPCFVRHKDRLILPSFGQYTGGLNINNPAFQTVAPLNEREIFLLHQGDILTYNE